MLIAKLTQEQLEMLFLGHVLAGFFAHEKVGARKYELQEVWIYHQQQFPHVLRFIADPKIPFQSGVSELTRDFASSLQYIAKPKE